MNPAYNPTPYFPILFRYYFPTYHCIFLMSSHLHILRLRILYSYLIICARATNSVLLILGEYITLIIFGEERKSLSSLLRNFLHTPVILFLVDQTGREVPLYVQIKSQLHRRKLSNLPHQMIFSCHSDLQQWDM